jgi:hypothetical protein
MIGSSKMPQPQPTSAADSGPSAARDLSDQECVERLQVAIADHASAQPAGGAAVADRQEDVFGDAGPLREVAALIGRLAVPLDD